MLTQAEFRTLTQRARVDPLPFMAQACLISTKQLTGQSPVMTLTANGPQRKVYAALAKMRAEGMPPRVIVLKARQPGISSFACALNLVTKLTQPYAQTITVAHLEDASEKLFRREKFMVDRLPLAVRPKLKIDRKGELLFQYVQCRDGRIELSSTGATGWATGKPIWRGMTIHGVHLSEFAFFGSPASEVLLGVLQSVPRSPDSYVVIESTANGMGNPFQEEYARAESGESGFEDVFIGWYELPDAIAPVPPDFKLESDERDIVREFGLTLAQMVWRRNTLYTECQGNLDLFRQEYPSTAAESFLVTGRPAFPVPVLRKMHEKALKIEPRRGRLDMTLDDPRRQLVVRADGEFAIWKWPVEGHLYVVGADPSAGIEDGDYGAAAVLDRTTQEVVAVWHGLASPIRFAHMLMDIGQFYNGAMLVPEITGGCLARGTKISTPGGDVPVEDLIGAQPWVFGMRDGHLVLAQATSVRAVRPDAACVRLTYSWQAGRLWRTDAIVCTPEHPILLRDGTYRAAGNLHAGDRLMPFSQGPWKKKRDATPRMRIRTGPAGRWLARARWVWEQLHGPVPAGHHVHHVDEQPMNDAPENLESWLGTEHNGAHSAAYFRETDPVRQAARAAKIKASWADRETRALRQARMREAAQRPEEYARKSAVMTARHQRRRGDNHVVVSVEPAGEHDVFELTVPGVQNFATHGIVAHNHGFSVVEECRARGYWHLYQWQRTDRVKNTTTNFLGWMTTHYSRPLLFDAMHYALSNGDVMIWDPATIWELMGCRYLDGHRAEGEDHDDLAFATMIAWRVHLETPMADGQLPRTARGEAKKAEAPTSPLRGVEREVWDETDQTLRHHQTRPLGNLETLVVTEDELQAPAEEVSDYDGPPGGWW